VSVAQFTCSTSATPSPPCASLKWQSSNAPPRGEAIEEAQLTPLFARAEKLSTHFDWQVLKHPPRPPFG
jgi:hypothetical protein